MPDHPKHHVLIIGAGSIGERHARCFSGLPGVRVGIVEPGAARREQLVASHGWTAYPSLPEALDEGSWTTAVICTPAPSHVAVALRCLDAGLPVLIEKPLAVESRDAELLVKRSQTCEHAIGVAYVHRAHPAVAAMREALSLNRFGRPLQVVANVGQNFPFFRPAYAQTYYAHHASGGGAIQDALTHVFNTVEWFVGPMTRLLVDAEHLVLPEVEVEDTAHVLARHDGVMASYTMNQFQAPNEAVVTVACERGTARLDLTRHRWQWQTAPDGDWTTEAFDLESRDAWFGFQARAWIDVIENGTAPLCSLTEAMATLRDNERALESARSGGIWLNVDG